MDTGASARAEVVVIGGGYAGVLAAVRAAARLGGRARVVLVSDRDALVERIRLHETIARGRDPRRPLAPLLAAARVEIVRAQAEHVDLASRTVRAGGRELRYERLIVALGSRSGAPAIPGAAEHAHPLDPERAMALHQRIVSIAARGGRVVVVGGGLSGLELATELAEAHPRLGVVLATAGLVGERLSDAARAHARRACARLGVELLEGARVERVEEDAVVIDGARTACDACIATAGFEVPAELARWGFPVDAHGRARVDARLRLEGAPDVYVAGDCAALPHDLALGSPPTMGCKSAMPMGAHAAENAVSSLLGRAERAHRWVDLAWCTSLGRRDGILQWMRGDGTPARAFAGGWLAARIKEIICRYTVRSIELEIAGTLRYRWPRGAGLARAARLLASGAGDGPARDARALPPSSIARAAIEARAQVPR